MPLTTGRPSVAPAHRPDHYGTANCAREDVWAAVDGHPIDRIDIAAYYGRS
jgi:hypothetical protein